MKSLLATLIVIVSSTSAFAADTVLLDCNILSGPNQQFKVIQTVNGYKLWELLSTGQQTERAVTPDEWNSKRFIIQPIAGQEVAVTRENGEWMVKSVAAGGTADCAVDRIAK